ncbi:MAG: DUF1499 domain-containing protein [Gammaproteobacteria bacterium]|nr:DUF1499 domain-containing protein [Gammaproteobacteria bacterium]
MKSALIILLVLFAAAVIWFFVLALISKSGEAPGLVDEGLSKCPNSPNCVGSEYKDDTEHYIEPIVISQNLTVNILPILKQTVLEMGGTIQVESDHYIAATFSSSIFGFVDDLEIRIEHSQKMIHLRSASRVGHSDFGVNMQRAELLRQIFNRKVLEETNQLK